MKFALIVLSLFASLSLAACGGDQSGSGGPGGAPVTVPSGPAGGK